MQIFFPPKGSKIALAMSGGVDSSVAAKILVDKGYKVMGFWMKLHDGSPGRVGIRNLVSILKPRANRHLASIYSSVRRLEDQNLTNLYFSSATARSYELAEKTAAMLKIPLYVLDLRKEFQKWVIDEFTATYERGETPNPCVICNRMIKFGAAWEFVKKRLGVEYLATGHYVRVANVSSKLKAQSSKPEEENRLIFRARDERKDQSYFLYAIDKNIIDRLVFPIGDFSKQEVRKMARKWQLPAAQNRDSQNICFAPNLRLFLQQKLPKLRPHFSAITKKCEPAEVVDTNGHKLGKLPKGIPLWYFTTGQRARFDLDRKKKTNRTPKYYTVAKDNQRIRLIVGSKIEASRREFKITDVNWLVEPEKDQFEAWVKIRNTGQMLRGKVCRGPAARSSRPMASSALGGLQALDGTPSACVTRLGIKPKPKHNNNCWQITLRRPELGVAPGQAAVVYRQLKAKSLKPKARNEWVVIGGGRIV